MGNERLLQVLDNSACLTSRQLDDYLKHTLFPEELRVVELHLSGCPFCSDALDGLEQQQHQLAALLSTMSLPALPEMQLPEKIKEKKEPESQNKTGSIVSRHYNSTKTTSSFNKWKMPLGVAAALLIGFGALWFLKFKKDNDDVLAVNTETNTDTLTGLNNEQTLVQGEPGDLPASTDVQASERPAETLAVAKSREQDPVLNATDSNTVAAISVTTTPTAKEIANDLRDTEKAIAPEPQAVVAVSRDKKQDKRIQATQKEQDNEPPAARSNYKIGLDQYNQQEYEKALGYFKQAESDAADPNHWNAVYYTGMCYKALGKKRKAIRQFKQIIDSDNQSRKAAALKQLDELK